jgi:hypothetical protein
MKILFLFLSISFSLQAQSDSTNITFSEEKVEKFEKTTLVDEYEKAFGGNRVVKSGLRIRIETLGNGKGANLQYEQKLGKAISLLGSLSVGLDIFERQHLNSSLEGRWYYKMSKSFLVSKVKIFLRE